MRDGRNYNRGYINALWQWRKVKTSTGKYNLNKSLHLNGYIDVGDECWTPNVLVTSLRCW